MRKIRLLISLFLIFLPIQNLRSEIIIMSSCNDKQDEFLKNEYVLNLNQLIMTRNYVYKEKTYQKYKVTDLRIKKSNTYVRNIYEEDGKIFTHKHGYPQFYTQIVFEKGKPEIYMMTVLNDEKGISKISTCKKIEKFKNES
jgi:hypothetical protein